jgi:hypothetical protein
LFTRAEGFKLTLLKFVVTITSIMFFILPADRASVPILTGLKTELLLTVKSCSHQVSVWHVKQLALLVFLWQEAMVLADGEGDVLESDALDMGKLLSSQGSPGTVPTGMAT